jgi:hypothetical protein
MTIKLTARTNKNGKIWIEGSRAKKSLPRGSGPRTFEFTLDDKTNPTQNVKFSGFDSEDDWPCCPPPGGNNSSQLQYAIDPGGLSASFVDANDNSGGSMSVCYRWRFSTDDGQHPTFDPIIDNGGR